MIHKKKDLVYWLAPRSMIYPYIQHKHWGIITAFNRSKKQPQAYLISDNAGHWVDLNQIVPATLQQVIGYMRRQHGYSAANTRYKIDQAMQRVN